MKNNYARIQTIAHECLHSCQDRTLLMFNFIFSNINMIYFFVISILTLFKIINNFKDQLNNSIIENNINLEKNIKTEEKNSLSTLKQTIKNIKINL